MFTTQGGDFLEVAWSFPGKWVLGFYFLPYLVIGSCHGTLREEILVWYYSLMKEYCELWPTLSAILGPPGLIRAFCALVLEYARMGL